MEFQIREFEMKDAAAIHMLNCVEMGYDFPLADTEKKLSMLRNSGKDKIYVALTDNRVVGYIHVNDYDAIYFPHMKNIMGIAVSREYQRCGAGTALLRAAESWAKRDGARGVRLVSGSSRTQAHEFYRHCGYGREKNQINFKKIFSS